ncbi:MAG: ATP-binding protein [Bacteroidales bacterium]|nr:ATP-binding protein [Bacteroidales bacterium]
MSENQKYYPRKIDQALLAWKDEPRRKPLLLRGARQVGKSTAVRQLGKHFEYYAEINLEKQPSLKALFTDDIDVKALCAKLSGILSIPIEPGKTLLFIDEIQASEQAIRSLRYFKEDYPELHVVGAGSLLEFALEELPSFGVGRIKSLYMYPFSFDEFLIAQGLNVTVDYKGTCKAENPLPELAHQQLIEQLRTFFLVGGLPAAVAEWVETKSYINCNHIHAELIDSYITDFAKYKKKISPTVLRQVWQSAAMQVGKKFVYSQALHETHSSVVREALEKLTLAGLIIPVTHTNANGLPLGAEADNSYRKYLFLDTGIMLSMLKIPNSEILLSSVDDLVDKGGLSEMHAGLEMIKYSDPLLRPELFYWQRVDKKSNAEVDYVSNRGAIVLPIEVKSNTRGSMQSLYEFMRQKKLHLAVRTSLENFGQFQYTDPKDQDAIRTISIVPLYALATLSE